MKSKLFSCAATAAILAASTTQAAPTLIAIGSLNGNSDLSGLTGTLENGLPSNVLGGIGSGIAWAGGNTFLVLPDRGPNATAYANGALVDNTTSYISRFQTVTMDLTPASGGSLPFTLTPTLSGTTLLYSSTALSYGNTAGLPSAVPGENTSSKFYFTGRSDNFDASANSLNPNNARLDPESIRVANDGKSVFISDEYGPYVYQFDRVTGERLKTFTLPANLAIASPNALGATEISGNTAGRVANKGMEGLAITPDGKTLVGVMQSSLIQDGGDGARINRLVTIDIASGVTHEYAYDNRIGTKTYGLSDIVAINDHEFLIDERDGKGLGDGSTAVIKQLYKIDISGAADVAGISGENSLLPNAVAKTLFLDLKTIFNANGISDANIPAKIEGLSFGDNIVMNGQTLHTLFVTNDNDFVPTVAGSNNFYVFAFSDADLANFVNQSIAPVPLPAALPLLGSALGIFGLFGRRRRSTKPNNLK